LSDVSPAPTDWATAFHQRSRSARSAFLHALADPEPVQAEVLRTLLSANQDSDFGREHDFSSLKTADDFRAAMPIRFHEDFVPWLDRTIGGESGVLSAEDPIMYFSSSGTTGAEKRIPATVTYLKDCFLPFYFAGLAPALSHHPALTLSDSSVLNLWQDPYSRMGRTDGGQPHIGPSQIDFKRLGEQAATGLGNRAPWSDLPGAFADSDPWERTYLRVRLAAEHDVRCVLTVNPAIASALPYQLREWWPRIVKEIHDGTLGGLPYGAPDPDRARAIEAAARRSGTVRPCDIWPRLELIITWTTYIAGLCLPRLVQEYGPGVRVLPAPMGSCEGPLMLPVDRNVTAGALPITACLYEFVPAELDLGAESETLLAHQLEAGRDYHVVLSHVGGLYRCATRDVIRVTGHIAGTPRIEFCGRDGALSVAGERLQEHEVIRALSRAAAGTGLDVRNVAWRVDPAGADRPAHQVVVAFQHAPTETELETFTELLDAGVAAECPGYRTARRSDRLGRLTVRATDPEPFFRYWRQRVEAGQRPPRVKDRVFQPATAFWARLANG
jgi:hypothetical protein